MLVYVYVCRVIIAVKFIKGIRSLENGPVITCFQQGFHSVRSFIRGSGKVREIRYFYFKVRLKKVREEYFVNLERFIDK